MTLIPSRGYDEGIRFSDLLISQKGELHMTNVESTLAFHKVGVCKFVVLKMTQGGYHE